MKFLKCYIKLITLGLHLIILSLAIVAIVFGFKFDFFTSSASALNTYEIYTMEDLTFNYAGIINFSNTLVDLANKNTIFNSFLNIKEVFGEYGKCFRIGGDEFEIIILNENKSFINLLIDRFKSNIDNMTLSSGSKVYVSIGATFDDGMLSKHKSIANLINITDRLMYENKHINKMSNHLE